MRVCLVIRNGSVMLWKLHQMQPSFLFFSVRSRLIIYFVYVSFAFIILGQRVDEYI